MARNFRAPRKTKTWSGIGTAQALLTGNATAAFAGVSVGETFTIMRVISEYIILPTSTVVALDRVTITMALGIFSTDAFTLGATGLPDPSDEPGYPWLYWKSHYLKFTGTDPQLQAATMSGAVRQAVDVKGMRKIRQEQTLGWVVQYTDESGTPPITAAVGSSRILLAD